MDRNHSKYNAIPRWDKDYVEPDWKELRDQIQALAPNYQVLVADLMYEGGRGGQHRIFMLERVSFQGSLGTHITFPDGVKASDVNAKEVCDMMLSNLKSARNQF